MSCYFEVQTMTLSLYEISSLLSLIAIALVLYKVYGVAWLVQTISL